MQKGLMTMPSSPKPIIVKAGNHDQKIQNKNSLCVYFKRKLLHF